MAKCVIRVLAVEPQLSQWYKRGEGRAADAGPFGLSRGVRGRVAPDSKERKRAPACWLCRCVRRRESMPAVKKCGGASASSCRRPSVVSLDDGVPCFRLAMGE